MIRTGVLVCFLLSALLSVHGQDFSTLNIIANAKGAPAEMKKGELKNIFEGGLQRWSNGTKVVIALIRTDTPLGEEVCKKVYNRSPDDVDDFWMTKVFQGKASRPYFFSTSKELEDFVSRTPGAIGIIDKVAVSQGTRILAIN